MITNIAREKVTQTDQFRYLGSFIYKRNRGVHSKLEQVG